MTSSNDPTIVEAAGMSNAWALLALHRSGNLDEAIYLINSLPRDEALYTIASLTAIGSGIAAKHFNTPGWSNGDTIKAFRENALRVHAEVESDG